MRILIIFTVLSFYLYSASAHAEWQPLTTSPIEFEQHAPLFGDRQQGSILAGGEGSIWLYNPQKSTWSKVMSFDSPSSKVLRMRTYRDFEHLTFACSTEGLWRSLDSGKKWKKIFGRYDSDESTVNDIVVNSNKSNQLFVGTNAGLFISLDGGITWSKAVEFGTQAIYQFEINTNTIYIAAQKGLYEYDLVSHAVVFARDRTLSHTNDDGGNAQMMVENIPIKPSTPFTFNLSQNDQSVIILDSEIIKYNPKQKQSVVINAATLPTASGMATTLGRNSYILPTNSGMYRVNGLNGVTELIAWDLPDKRIKSVHYNAVEDRLYALSAGQIYFLEHPLWEAYVQNLGLDAKQKKLQIEAYFSNEPSIIELQNVAMHYAEVHPEKIANWRKSVSQKAWFPKVGVGLDMGVDQTVELDRGGTDDPDQFIFGPNEKDTQWSFDVSWDLSELIWSSDQTSIDTRSRLTTQLRDEILTRLTRLFFAKRRLQIEGLLNPNQSIGVIIETELRIKEYIADIDALTGGYYSRALTENIHSS